MKVRHGFVSNSSTSSFLCDVCGDIQADRDLCLSDAEMRECINGHTFCDSHMLGEFDVDAMSFEEKKQILLNASSYYSDKAGKVEADIEELFDSWKGDARYEMPSTSCPLCQLDQVPDEMMFKYLFKTTNSSKEELTKQIREQYGTYEKLAEAMKD